MPVVVNEFEIVAEPPVQPPASPTARGGPAGGDLAGALRALLAQARERTARVRAY